MGGSVRPRPVTRGQWLVALAGLLCILVAAADVVWRAHRRSAPAPRPPQALRATASLPPVAGLVRTLAGDAWTVDSLLGPGQDPHVYEPTPRQVSALAESSLFFRTGMPFEEALAARVAAAHPDVRIVPLAPEAHGEEEHEHGHDRRHHDEAAVHGWLSPHSLESWAHAIADALVEAEPAQGEAVLRRLAAWVDALDAEEAATRAAAAGSGVRAFAAYHPAYGAWAADCGLEQIALEVDGKAPGPRTLEAARARIAGTGATVLLVQGGAEAARAAAFARDAGLRVAVVPPLADDPLATLRALREAVFGAPP